MSRRLAAICCCNATGGAQPCAAFASACFPTFPRTVTLSFGGTYLVETVDPCSGTVTATDYWTYSGTATGTLSSAQQAAGGVAGGGVVLCGTATATRTQTGKTNEYNGTNCGTWSPCFTSTDNFGTCNTSVDGLPCGVGVSCDGGLVGGDNVWAVNTSFYGTGTIQGTAIGVCCNPGCGATSNTRIVDINVFGVTPPGVCNPGSCGCLYVQFGQYGSQGSVGGPLPLGSGSSDDTATYGTRSTWTGFGSLAFS